jgi:selenocysteine lyase/cysteine desulfurase
MDKVASAREEFPALTKWLFFGSAGIGPLPRCALAAMRKETEALLVDFDRRAWEEDVRAEARSLAARLVGASPEEIVLVPSTSAGINLLAGSFPWRRGDSVVLNDLEYPANVFPWLYQAERHGLEVRVVRSRNGIVPLDDLVEAIDRRTRVLALSHVEFALGYRHDLAALAEAVHAVGGLLCVDAIQSLGVLRVDVEKLGIDVLATGGYKWLCGPLGTGFTYVRRDLLETLWPPTLAYGNLPKEEDEAVWNALVAGRDYPMDEVPVAAGWKRLEGVEGLSPILVKGFSASLCLFLDLGIDWIEGRIEGLVSHLIERLCEEKVKILSPTRREERAGIVTAAVPFDLSRKDEVKGLEKRLEEARIQAHPRGGGLRLSVHFFNTEEEIDRVVGFLRGLGH